MKLLLAGSLVVLIFLALVGSVTLLTKVMCEQQNPEAKKCLITYEVVK